MKFEISGKLMKESFGLRAKTYRYLINDSSEDEKAKCTKMFHKEKTYISKL